MSIEIDTNLIYLKNRLNLSPEKLKLYQGKSVTDIITAETAAGNPLAVALATQLLTDVNLIIELFKLADPSNKYVILRNMNFKQLCEFLPLMEDEDLLQGLMFFTQDKLLKMLEKVPPEQLVKTVLELFSQEEVIEFMPEEQLDKFLTNESIDKNKMLQHLKSIPPEYLAQIIESVKGEECKDQDNIDMVNQISKFNPLEYRDALTSLQPTQKRKLTLGLVKEDQKLYQLFDARAYTNMINQNKQKPEIVKAMAVLENEEIIKMIKELPDDLLSIVVTQIDTEVFGNQLMNKFPELIAELLKS